MQRYVFLSAQAKNQTTNEYGFNFF